MNRREATAVIGATLVAGAFASPAAALGPLGEAVTAMFGQRRIRNGRVTVDLPAIAEDGSFVPLTVSVESAMTETDRVASIAVFAPDNPRVLVASVAFGPRAPKAEFRTIVRLAQSQNVVVIAQMADGSLWRGRAPITVTPGTCESFPVN